MIAIDLNTLVDYLAARDVPELSQSALTAAYQLQQVDVFVLFGGSILAGGDVLTQAMQNQIAKHYIIVGGAGHTTDGFRDDDHGYGPRGKGYLSHEDIPAEVEAAYERLEQEFSDLIRQANPAYKGD